VAAQKTPSQLLAPLDTLCMYRAEDWWTYELCFGKSVRQFHKEGDRVVSEYVLGEYSAQDTLLDEVRDDGSGGKFVMQASARGSLRAIL
jgi:protein OS-9